MMKLTSRTLCALILLSLVATNCLAVNPPPCCKVSKSISCYTPVDFILCELSSPANKVVFLKQGVSLNIDEFINALIITQGKRRIVTKIECEIHGNSETISIVDDNNKLEYTWKINALQGTGSNVKATVPFAYLVSTYNISADVKATGECKECTPETKSTGMSIEAKICRCPDMIDMNVPDECDPWVYKGYNPGISDETKSSTVGFVLSVMEFRYIRKFTRKYKCLCCNQELISDGLRGRSVPTGPEDIFVFKNVVATPWPPVRLDKPDILINAWEVFINAGVSYHYMPGYMTEPAPTAMDSYGSGLMPSSDDFGEVIKEPTPPTCNCLH
jgi:hypothetical protein